MWFGVSCAALKEMMDISEVFNIYFRCDILFSCLNSQISDVFLYVCLLRSWSSAVHEAIWYMVVLLLRGEVSRAADRLHKPPLLHKRRHVLSNCQNVYVKNGGRSSVWGSLSPLCVCEPDFLHECACLPSSVLVFVYSSASTFVCVCTISLLLTDKPYALIHFTQVSSSYSEQRWTR